MAPLAFFNFHHRLDLHRVGQQHLLSQVVLLPLHHLRLGQQVELQHLYHLRPNGTCP
jgi:hypothetical protein